MNYKILINKDNLYDEFDFSNRELVKYININDTEFLVEKKTLNAFLRLKKDLEKDNIFIDIISGYRSVLEQKKLFNSYKNKYGINYTNKYVAKEYTSEHHSGLAIDIGIIIDNQLIEDEKDIFNYLEILDKVIEKIKDYGFILRYPKDKEEITGYNYEPWHYRYVGKSTANFITINKLTLEEYDLLYNKSGVLLVNKKSGVTSRDVVNEVCRVFNTKKVGHNGTLDPLAEGLLVITINNATKINEILTNDNKEYIAKVKVGIETDTLDLEGNIVRKSDKKITIEDIINLFKNFPKEYIQEVPKYSAVKVNGKKLYEYARNNEKIELPKRKVIIKELELLDYSDDSFSFRVVVSKGTYIRSIIKDMGDILNIPCTMSYLKRTKCGKFKIEDAISNININSNIIDIDKALDIPKLEILDEDYKRIVNGAITNNKYNVKDAVLFTKNNKLIAIYKNDNNKLRCYKIIK